jgi:hypothetical protein
MIDQRPDHYGTSENPQIQEEKHRSLLCQGDLQARAHCRQAKYYAQDGKNNPENEDACA